MRYFDGYHRGVKCTVGRSYRLVVFDWEGTLGDTLGQILDRVSYAAKCMQLGELDEQLARKYAVLGLTVAVKKLFPDLSLHQYEQLLHTVQQSWLSHPIGVYLLPGAADIVQQMHSAGITLAVATNKGQQALQRALQASGLHDLFTVTRSAGQVPAKPCPQMLLEIMQECGMLPSETLMIGDSVTDMEMAKQANVDAIGVDFYHQQEPSLLAAGALQVFDDYQQLANYLHLPQ